MGTGDFIFRSHAPIEIFGFHPDDTRLLKQRESRKCPFTDQECTKRLYRTNKPPSGSCSVSHDGKDVIICPNRFLANHKEILFRTAKQILKTSNIKLVPEVTLPRSFGRVDWVAVVTGSNDAVLDFVPIETHANQTTSTGGLTDAIAEHELNGRLSKDTYKYGLNTYHQIKTFFTQCLIKSQLFEKWNRNYIWILDDSVYDNWRTRLALRFDEFNLKDKIFFYSYGLNFDNELKRYSLVQKAALSTNRKVLLEAYNTPSGDLPNEKEFIATLTAKM